MSKVIDVTIDQNMLENELHALAVSFSRTVAQYSKNALVEAQASILNRYYQDVWWSPTPKRYHRTKQLLKQSYKGIYKSPHGTNSFGGIAFTPERMHYDKFSSEQVVEDFLSGWHGGQANASRYPELNLQASFVPYTELLRVRDNIVEDICSGSVGVQLFDIAKQQAKLSIIS